MKKLLLASLLALTAVFSFVPANVYAAIAFVSTSTTVNPASDTVAYDATATNGYLVVQTLVRDNRTVSAVSYAGIPMTQLTTNTIVVDGETYYQWGLAAPTTGTNNIVVTKSGATTLVVDVALYSGAQQTTAVEATNTGSGATSPASISVTTTTDNDWLIGYFRAIGGASAFTAGANTVVRTSAAEGPRQMVDSGADQTPAGSFSLNVTYTGVGVWAGMAFALKPYVAPVVSTASILSLVKAFWIF